MSLEQANIFADEEEKKYNKSSFDTSGPGIFHQRIDFSIRLH